MKPKSVINDSNSAPQVPFTTMLALLCMWFGISMPLVYLGYYFGFRKQPYDNPVRTNQIPRQVPEQRWYMNKFVGWVGHAPLHHCHGESRALWSPLGSSPPESSWLGSYRSAPCSLSCSSSSAWVKPAAVGSEPDRLWWPLRLCLHTGHLGEPVLLPLWLLVPGLHHPGGVLLSDQHRHGVFPALCRGKPYRELLKSFLLLFFKFCIEQCLNIVVSNR